VHDPLDLRDVLADELDQRRQSGYEVEGLADGVAAALRNASGRDDPSLVTLLQRLSETKRAADWPFLEVEAAVDLVGALGSQPAARRASPPSDLRDRLLGAWLGRCAGCLLGKPVEGWTAEQVHRYLERADAWPLDGYVPRLTPHPSGSPLMKPSWPEATRGAIAGMARDDDLDYTVVALLLLERTGGSPTAEDVGAEWLARLPAGQMFTAERAAYRNLLLGLVPPHTAWNRNPYREWIGALIRADAYAYASPGDPLRAAELAARDASVSHVGNGIAAAMWAAAVISLALAGVSPAESVPEAAAVVPAGSRLDLALRQAIDFHRTGMGWEDSRRQIMAANAQYGWVHAIPNAAIIASALLWGGGDFERSVTLAVSAGCDTDSNGATVGSAIGAFVGAGGLPKGWTDPLQDQLRTSVAGMGSVSISSLAERSFRVATKL
jgi:ADP-ribosylglycohydrolase